MFIVTTQKYYFKMYNLVYALWTPTSVMEKTSKTNAHA